MDRFISEDPIKDGLNWYSYCGGNPVGFVDPSGLNELDYSEIINGINMTTEYREDLRVILNEFNGVIKVEGDKIKIKVFDKDVIINISDYKDADHFIEEHLHFTYSEFFEICGIEYDKSVMRVDVTRTDEGKARVKYALQESGKEIVTGIFIGEIAKGVCDNLSQFWDAAMSLKGYFDYENDIPPVLKQGKYVMNSYTVYNSDGNVVCAFNQIVPTGIDTRDSFIKFEYWNGENSIHSYALLNGYEKPLDFKRR